MADDACQPPARPLSLMLSTIYSLRVPVTVPPENQQQTPHRCGYVALAGRPNVGKSTLLNTLVGQHLSIVSPKAQTTRERVSGILTTSHYQILFIDAPGLIEPRYALQEAMRLAASAAIDEADVVVLVVDATEPDTFPDQEIGATLRARSVPIIIAVNKVDLVDGETAARLVGEAEALGYSTLAISATTGAGLSEFLSVVVDRLPESAALFPEEDSATQSVRFFAEEYVRETCLELLHEELPYAVTCRVDEFREGQDPVYVRIVIYVERESQKGIVIGRGGATIKQIGQRSREKIEALVERRVYLELHVKVLEGWRRKHARLRQLGYALPSHTKGGQKRT